MKLSPSVAVDRTRVWLQPASRDLLRLLVAALFLFPFYMMLQASIRPPGDQVITVFPSQIRWSNYVDVLRFPGFPFLRLLWNSLFYAGLATLGTVCSSALIAYGFARFRFPGRNWLFTFLLATMMLPFVATLIPNYVLFRYFGLVNTYVPLILPHWFGDPFFIFLLRQFFLTLPRSLFDAAVVDGAGEFRIFISIALPLMRPALIVVAILAALFYWNDFLGPLVFIQDPEKYPLALGLYAFQGQHQQTNWPFLMAGASLIALPVIALFFGLQRYFVSGLSVGGFRR